MSDKVVQPVSGQVEGTTAESVSSQDQSQSAVMTGQEPTSQNETVEAKQVTALDLEALRVELRKEIQSQVDKRDTRVNKRLAEIDSAVAILRASGREITDEDVKTLKQNAAAKAMIEPEQEPIVEQTADPLNVKTMDPSDPVVRKIIELQLKYGMEIKSDMPQAAKIVRGKGPVEFVKSYEAALKEATSNPSASTQAIETKPAAPPAARIPAHGGTPVPTKKSGRAYLEDAHN